MPEQVKKSLVISIYFALAVSTLLVFWQVRNFDFVNYDDDLYIYENPHIISGLTFDNIKWAFTAASHIYFWHPLTWLSHILDWQIYGPNAGGHHITNLIFHIANILLLFIVLRQITGKLWQSTFVAALFALHPLHVESVAWLYERKDVLSTFFWFLTMWAYIRYVRHPKIAGYLLVVAFFVLGLLSKPMLVTLPFVLLLLDYWPLDRLNSKSDKAGKKHSLPYLLVEKVPLFVMVLVSCIITFNNQKKIGAMGLMENLSLFVRLANTSISYMQYIIKMIWPSRLAVFYPYSIENVSVLYVVISVILLLAVTILVLRFAQNHRYLATGWFWYLGTLIPVIGIVQIGAQAYADRYTYIPYIGLFIMLAWGLPELLPKWTQRKIALGLSMVIVLTSLGICAHRQTSYWKDSFTLFSHAIEVTQNNYLAHYNLGTAYSKLGRWQDAIETFRYAIKIKPDYADAYLNLGVAYVGLGRYPEAMEDFRQAIKIKPYYAEAHSNLGFAYDNLGRYQDAIEAFSQAIKIKPDYAEAHYNLGVVYDKLGRYQDAIETLRQAIKIKPDYAEAHNNLGFACNKLGRYQEAIDAHKQALKIKPDYADAYLNLGVAYVGLGRYPEAIEAYKQAIRIKPDYAKAHYNLGCAYLAIGDKNSALTEYKILKTLDAEKANTLFNLINK